MSEPKDQNEAACGGSALTAELDAAHKAGVLKYMDERRAGLPAVHGELGVWKAAWDAAIDAVIAEWEKPWVQAEGKQFIQRLREMKASNA